MQLHTLLHETCGIICNALHAVTSLLLQSGKFWWYLLLTPSMLLHDVIMTSYCCQRYAECQVTTVCSSGTVHSTWQNWMAAYLCYTLRMKTLFCGWPVMVDDTHTRRRSTPTHCAAHVQQLNCCIKKRQTFLRPTCGLQTTAISVLWITRSGLSYSIVSTTDISIVWMKRQLISIWCSLEQLIFDEAVDQWQRRAFRVQLVNWQCWFCPWF